MYDPVTELEHYGVLGMKWGVRRTPGQLGHRQERKLNRYKEKEIGKIKKRMASDKADRQLYKDNFNRIKADYKKQKTSVEEYEDAKEFDSLSRLDFKLRRKEAMAEIEAIKQMSYKDMRDRRKKASKMAREVGKVAARSAIREAVLMNLSAVSLSGFQHPMVTRRKQIGTTALNAALTVYEFMKLKEID